MIIIVGNNNKRNTIIDILHQLEVLNQYIPPHVWVFPCVRNFVLQFSVVCCCLQRLIEMSEDKKFRIGVDVGGKISRFSFISESAYKCVL
jgi:hypothetical protein